MTDTASGEDRDDTVDSGSFLAALGTERFVLQSAAISTIGESGTRASIYLASLSLSLSLSLSISISISPWRTTTAGSRPC